MSGPAPSNPTRPTLLRRTAGSAAKTPSGVDPLRSATKKILREWEARSARWMASRDEAEEVLQEVLREVERILAGKEPEAPPDQEVQRPLLRHRLIEALRVELTRDLSSGASEATAAELRTTLQLLAALENCRARLWASGTEELAKRLSEPDAFELVVELVHDLRSPLNSILFLSEALRSGHSGPVSEHQHSQLGLVYSATLGMISVVNDVMDTASEGAGANDDDPVVFSLVGLFESVDEIVRPMAEEKGLDLAFRTSECDRCVGFPKLLSRVLLNLTTNALKFTEEGTVTVSARQLGRRQVEFSISDTGRGIPPQKLESLFHPFQKSSYRPGFFFSGSGLGLSIARRLVATMGGELEVESSAGEGTRFSFELELPSASGH